MVSVSGKGKKILLMFFAKYTCFGFVNVCILMIKTRTQLVLQKTIWLTEIRTEYANCHVLGLAVLLVKASLKKLLY